MALTLTNRETFEVLAWLEADAARIAHVREHARRLAREERAIALPRLSDIIYDTLEQGLPSLDGVAAALMQAGLKRVNFFELALAFLIETGAELEARAA
jgi:coproporphyrinogen III oxidase-like Fe-S oxidoreductase